MNVQPLRTLQTALGLSGDAVDGHYSPVTRIRVKTTLQDINPATKTDWRIWWQCWDAEGWVSLGRTRNYDWMHVQAARI